MTSKLSDIPRAIWALGLVSLCMDLSSEMIHSLLPVFMVGVLGSSVAVIGFIEGVAEAVALISKVFSGLWSDFSRKRKSLALLGYGLAALTKPIFALAPTMSWVAGARFADRLGKGIRGAPRDALIGDLAPMEIRGACFGLRQALDTVGAFLGPLAAVLLMLLYSDNIRLVFWVAAVPAWLAVVVLFCGVDEPKVTTEKRVAPSLRWGDLKRLSKGYWQLTAAGALLSLARFSEAFLVLRVQNLGLPVSYVPFVLVVMNIIYAATAYPVGKLSDRLPRSTLVISGIGLLIGADLVLALAADCWLAFLGIGLWGLHLGFSQGVLAAMTVDESTPELRGTAFGFFNLAGGISLLLGSALAGYLWDSLGPSGTFLGGAILSSLALAYFTVIRRQKLAPPAVPAALV